MSLLESSWYFLAMLVISITLFVDPEIFRTDSDINCRVGVSEQGRTYSAYTAIIFLFLVLTVVLSLDN